MSVGLPTAVINGIGRFGARKLAESLVQSDIHVIGVGNYSGGFSGLNNFELVEGLQDILEKINYLFDFDEDENAWEVAEKNESRLAIVGINRSIPTTERMNNLRTSWRVLNFHGVYGVGMGEGEKITNEKQEISNEIGWLVEAVKLAVANNNLVLPPRESVLRLLSDGDMTEAVMRGTFLSGTEGEVFEIWGRLVASEEIAQVLIDEAKMTRFKVNEITNYELRITNEKKVEEVWERLRWEPKGELAESMKEILQEVFSMKDEEGRKKPIKNYELSPSGDRQIIPQGDFRRGANYELRPEVKEETKVKPEKRFEVEVEEDPINNCEEKEPIKESREEILKNIMREQYGDLPKKVHRQVQREIEIEEVETEIRPTLVKNLNNRLVNSEQGTVNREEKKERKQTRRINWMKWGWGILGLGWVIITMVIVVFVVTNVGIYQNVKSLRKLINEKQYVRAEDLLTKTLITVRRQETGIEDWGLNQWLWGRRYQELLKVVEQGLMLGNKLVVISKQSELINEGIFKDKEIDWKKEVDRLRMEVSGVSDDLRMLNGRLAGDWKWVPDRWRGSLTEIKNQLADVSRVIDKGEKVLGVLPEILGTDGKRREYLVLFQNENELRPGGGFIGSYGILSFEGGGLRNFEIKDIYEADGQLKGHVEPPGPIKNYLGEAQWYMRDANWQPNFGGTSRDVQWFLDKETGRKVDGVLGIDLAVAKGLLGVVGEVYVPDFKEKINANNLYEQAEFYSETNSFPGSVQKASFLGGLGKQLFEEIKDLKGDKRWQLVQVLIDLAERNELQISLNNKTASGVMAGLGWNGEMYQGKCSSTGSGQGGCFADYLYIVEANLGVNKANYFLYRNIDQVVDIGRQTINRVTKISYENTAKNNNWPGGDYKNYIRVYLPASSNLAEVSVTDNSNGGVKTIYSGDSLKIDLVNGKKEVGFWVVVPAGAKRMVELRYLDQIDLTNLDKYTYMNYIQKQSGFGDTGMVNLVSIPEGWQVNSADPMATLVNRKLLFNQKLDRDIRLGVEISK